MTTAKYFCLPKLLRCSLSLTNVGHDKGVVEWSILSGTQSNSASCSGNPYKTHHKPLRGLLLDPCKLDNQASVLSLNHSKLPLACKLASWAIASSACSAWKPLTASCLQASSCCSCCSCCSCSSCCQPGWCIQVVTSEAWTCITLQRRLMLITFVHLVES